MPMPDRPRRVGFAWNLATAVTLAFTLAACCPAPAGAVGAPAGFAATIAAVDDAGYWAESRDGGRWRVAGAAPANVGERIYLEGVWSGSGGLRVDRVTPLPNPRP